MYWEQKLQKAMDKLIKCHTCSWITKTDKLEMEVGSGRERKQRIEQIKSPELPNSFLNLNGNLQLQLIHITFKHINSSKIMISFFSRNKEYLKNLIYFPQFFEEKTFFSTTTSASFIRGCLLNKESRHLFQLLQMT